MPYYAFACPECGSEVHPDKNIFCKNCGVNLSRYDQLQKKLFYYENDYCANCKKAGGMEFGRKQTEWKPQKDSDKYIRIEYKIDKCNLCGAVEKKIISITGGYAKNQ